MAGAACDPFHPARFCWWEGAGGARWRAPRSAQLETNW